MQTSSEVHEHDPAPPDSQQNRKCVNKQAKDVADDHSCEIDRVAFEYLTNNRDCIYYSSYRSQGLPTTSTLMESPIKEVNYRVKWTE